MESREPHVSRFCRTLFHYGVFDLPLPCRFHIANLQMSVALPSSIPPTPLYGQLEFLKMNVSNDTGGEGNGTTVGPDEMPDVAFSNLYPAVIECFVIILCGYMAGRCNLISQTESKGLGTFVGTFSLPALIFMSMAQLDFSSVNWLFLLSIFVSKSLVFFMVALITLLVYKPIDFGKAGLFAIFCTQSNDFALGYPIILALYNQTHPEFALYLYLVAPISLVFLNPIGFLLMEIGKRRSVGETEDEHAVSNLPNRKGEAGFRLAFQIVRDILLNPVVFMTGLGIIGNFIFDHNLPNILEGILKVLGQAFSASALFLLGLRMVGKIQTLRGSGFVVPGILITVKTLILPLVTREIVSLLKPGQSANETADYSNYGFLYGTFPTAPSVFVFATQYGVAIDMIASAMVACTFLSAPLMFVSAKMVTLVRINPLDYVKELEAFMFNISIIGLICTLWVLAVFLLSRKWKKVPHFVTLCLAVSQCMACIGALLWSVVDCNHSWKLYLQFILFSWGVFASRLWTALLAVTLFMLRWRSLCFVLRLRPYLAIVGWGIPGVMVLVLILVVQQESELANKHDPNFQYGATQAIVALLLLWFSLFTTMVCLILHQRYERRYSQYESLLNLDDPVDESGLLPRPSRSNRSSPRTSRIARPSFPSVASQNSLSSDENGEVSSFTPQKEDDASDSSDCDSLFSPHDNLCSPQRYRGCDNNRKDECRDVVQRYVSSTQLTEPEENIILRDRDDEFQMMRHVVLLLFLCGSMIVGFALCMWTLVTEDVNGVYVELVFLDVVLNFGQGFFTAAIFGLDTKLIVVPLLKRWRKFCYGASTVSLPQWNDLDGTTKQVCEQFSNYHMDKCIRDIVRDRRWRLKQLPAVFGGHELVDWLLMVGLARDRTDAIKYGRRLLQGQVIRHVDDQHHFHDQPLFYTFRPKENGTTGTVG